MPALTRRHYPEAQDECWHVYYGDVQAGTIAKRIGIPISEDPWGWSCGFYPGCHPGEHTQGTAPTFDHKPVPILRKRGRFSSPIVPRRGRFYTKAKPPGGG